MIGLPNACLENHMHEKKPVICRNGKVWLTVGYTEERSQKSKKEKETLLNATASAFSMTVKTAGPADSQIYRR